MCREKATDSRMGVPLVVAIVGPAGCLLFQRRDCFAASHGTRSDNLLPPETSNYYYRIFAPTAQPFITNTCGKAVSFGLRPQNAHAFGAESMSEHQAEPVPEVILGLYPDTAVVPYLFAGGTYRKYLT